MAEAARFQAARRARLDDAAVIGAHVVHGAWELTWPRYVERAAALACVLHESPAGRAIVEHSELREQLLAHAGFVVFEQVHSAGTMVAAAAARDAVRAARVGLAIDRRQAHASGHGRRTSCGATR